MEFFSGDIDELTLKNENYRKVLYTVPNSMQLVVMSLKPGEEIGNEVHPNTTQFIKVEGGSCIAIIDNAVITVGEGEGVVIPPGSWHNIINSVSSKKKLKLYSIYTPPEHREGLTQRKKPKREEH